MVINEPEDGQNNRKKDCDIQRAIHLDIHWIAQKCHWAKNNEKKKT